MYCRKLQWSVITGFSQRLENLEDENDHRKVMGKLAKNGNLWSVIEFSTISPMNFTLVLLFSADITKFNIGLEILQFPISSAKCRDCKI